jgi:3-deoxy-D-arabino-heptulosonate 7-phosphate (DAHP) synthase
MKTTFIIAKKNITLKYERKMPEKEVLKMKSFVTSKGDKLVKTERFKIKKITEKDKERVFEVIL